VGPGAGWGTGYGCGSVVVLPLADLALNPEVVGVLVGGGVVCRGVGVALVAATMEDEEEGGPGDWGAVIEVECPAVMGAGIPAEMHRPYGGGEPPPEAPEVEMEAERVVALAAEMEVPQEAEISRGDL
jgi:hypothetical protein